MWCCRLLVQFRIVRISEAATGVGEEMADVGLAMQRALDKTENMKARADAVSELEAAGTFDDLTALGPGQDDIDRQLSALSSGSAVDDDLAKMKAELSAGSAPAQDKQLEAGQALIVRIFSEGQYSRRRAPRPSSTSSTTPWSRASTRDDQAGLRPPSRLLAFVREQRHARRRRGAARRRTSSCRRPTSPSRRRRGVHRGGPHPGPADDIGQRRPDVGVRKSPRSGTVRPADSPSRVGGARWDAPEGEPALELRLDRQLGADLGLDLQLALGGALLRAAARARTGTTCRACSCR